MLHAVPKSYKTDSGPRFSIIAWGKRRTLNERNGGKETCDELNIIEQFETSCINNDIEIKNSDNNIEIKNSEVLELVNKLIDTHDLKNVKINNNKKIREKIVYNMVIC